MADEKKEPEAKAEPIPAEVKEAVAYFNADPEVPHTDIEPGKLLGFAVYPDRVVVQLASFQKYTVTIADLRAGIKAKIARLKGEK